MIENQEQLHNIEKELESFITFERDFNPCNFKDVDGRVLAAQKMGIKAMIKDLQQQIAEYTAEINIT